MQAEDFPGIIQQILSGCGKHRSARAPAEQVTIEARLEPFDLVADGRLRQAQGLGRAGYPAVTPDRPQGAQRIDFQTSAVELFHCGPSHENCEDDAA